MPRWRSRWPHKSTQDTRERLELLQGTLDLLILRTLIFGLQREEDYRELGADHFDRIDVNRIRRSLVRRLERLGHKATLEPLAQTA
jgi:hypothetical protein